jgi:hypothetical protein
VQRLVDASPLNAPDRLTYQWVTAFGAASRGELHEAMAELRIANCAEPHALADLCADVAARAFEIEIVREARAELGAFDRRIDGLLGDPAARERFLRTLARADMGDAVQWLRGFGLGYASSFLAAGNLSLTNAPAGTVDEATAARAFAQADALFVDGLRGARAAIADAQSALDTAGIATSPVCIARDYGPVAERVLRDVAPAIPSIGGSLLEEGMQRAVADHEATQATLAALRVAVKMCASLVAGPLMPLLSIGTAIGSTVYEGANHERIDAQRRIGISDGRASGFATYGEAAAENAAEVAVGLALGEAARGLVGPAKDLVTGEELGSSLFALFGEEAAGAFSLGMSLHRAAAND